MILAKLALLLAQTCVAEIGLQPDSTVDECRLMWEINDRNAKRLGRSLALQTRLFNSFWKSREQQARRPYIKHLKGREAPKGWPRHMRWDRYRDKWLAYKRAAESYVQRRGPWLCPGAIDYGGRGEIPRGRLKKISCLGGRTKQRYWSK